MHTVNNAMWTLALTLRAIIKGHWRENNFEMFREPASLGYLFLFDSASATLRETYNSFFVEIATYIVSSSASPIEYPGRYSSPSMLPQVGGGRGGVLGASKPI